MRRVLLAAVALAALAGLAACGAASPSAPAAGGPPLDAFGFFSGTTEGRGTLRPAVGAPAAVSVTGSGRVEGGVLHLEQTIREGSKLPRTRRWALSRVGEGRYSGTLTDAGGPVEAIETGSRLTIRYRSTEGYSVEQTLDRVAPDRVENRLVARIAGLQVAVLDETITRR